MRRWVWVGCGIGWALAGCGSVGDADPTDPTDTTRPGATDTAGPTETTPGTAGTPWITAGGMDPYAAPRMGLPGSRVDTGTPGTDPKEPEEPKEPVDHPDEPRGDVFTSNDVLVRPAVGVTEAQLASALGVVVRTDAVDGWWSVDVPPQQTAFEVEQSLERSALVDEASRVARIEGAAPLSSMEGRAHSSQWHLAAARAPHTVAGSLGGIVVAVLDTGVAYEHHQDERFAYVPAPTLSTVEVVAPYDFVNDDAHANDDHQHGTHIASLIASRGALEGVAPGVTLMPVKVLDEHNRGTEVGLLRGLQHAIANGADVINMSLSFPLGYVPSPALEETLLKAHQAGIVMVAAGGNQGQGQISWPAASRLVIGVGAAEAAGTIEKGQWDSGPMAEAGYSNLSNGLDLLAPGGVLTVDRNDDQIVDGMLAETVAHGDPSQTVWWLYAGTSQATAVVSGAVVHLLAAGADPHQVPALLQRGARTEGLHREVYSGGVGAGVLDIEQSLAEVSGRATPLEFTVGMLPRLASWFGGRLPAMRVWVDTTGGLTDDVQVVGTLVGPEGSRPVACTARASWGYCDLWGSATWSDERDLAWQFVVDGVVLDDVMHRPTSAVFATDTAELLLQALDQDASLHGAMMGFHFDGGIDSMLGWIEPAWVFPNTQTGPVAAPTALLLEAGALPVEPEAVEVDLNGTGMLSSPLGMLSARRLQFAGGALVSFEGTGLLSSPLQFHPAQFFGPGGTLGTGLLSSPFGFAGNRIDLGRQTATVSLSGTLLGTALAGDGLLLSSGDGAVDGLVGSGAVSLSVGGEVPKGSGAGGIAVP